METYGYDIVFACTIDSVNAELALAFEKMDTSCSWSGNDSKDQATVNVNAKLGPWQMVKGGSNKLLRFNIPFESGKMLIDCPVLGLKEKEYPLDSCSVEVEISLGWLGTGNVATSGSGSNTQLVFNMQNKGSKPGDKTDGAISVVTYSDTKKHLDQIGAAVLQDIIVELLLANKSKINYVFAQINPVPPSAASWLAPKKWDYFYQEPKSGPAVLCILSVLSEKAMPIPAFDSSVLSDDCDVFMILSPEQFLKNAVLPGLAASYGNGATAANFVYKTLGGTNGYIMNNGHIPTKTASWGADTYHPYITNLAIAIDGSNLTTKIVGDCDITGLAGASISFDGTGKSTSNYDPSGQKITFGNPTTYINHQKHIPWYDWVLGALSGGVGIAIIDAVIASVTSTVGQSVEDSVKSTTSSGISNDSVNTCNWFDKKMTQKAGGLSGSFWLRGRI